MNSRERFFNVLEGKPVDRRPFGSLTSLYGAKLTGCPLFKFYNDAGEFARGQDAVRQTVNPDFLVSPFLFAGYGEAFGSKLQYLENYVPNILKPAISSAKDISRLTVPDTETHPRMLYYRDAVRKIKASHGKDAVIVGIVLSPIDLPIVIMGLDAWLLTVLSDEDGTKRMLDITVPFFVRFCNALYQDGADVLAMPMAFLTHDVTTRHLAADFAVPVLRSALSQINGPMVCHHTGSSFFNYLDLLYDLPNVKGLTMYEKDDILTARKRSKPDTVLFAGLDGPTLYTLTADTVKSKCLEMLAVMKDDPYYIPFATGTDVDIRTPVENLVAIREAAEGAANA